MTPRRAVVLVLVAGACAALLPAVVHGDSGRSDATQALLLFVAAASLSVPVGWAGLPSLGQGAFVGLGAYGAAILRAKHGWDPVSATAAAVVIASVAGVVVGRAVRRLRPPFVALATWIGAWVFGLAVAAFPAVTGGARGLALAPVEIHVPALALRFRPGAVAWYELSVAMAALALLGLVVARRRYRPALVAGREDAPAAMAVGVPVPHLRAGAIAASAAAAGLAGALLAQAVGVADPATYGPLLSVKLFLVVLLGGADSLLGPAVGMIALSAVSWLASLLGSGPTGLRVQPLVTAVLLLAVLVGTRRGLVPEIADRVRRRRTTRGGVDHVDPRWDGASLSVRGVSVAFGGVQALAGVDLDAVAGTCHALVGPNGSGKTTVLRAIAGVITLDTGFVTLTENLSKTRDTGGQTGQAALPSNLGEVLGVARVLQRPALAAGLSSAEHVAAGAEAGRRMGLMRTLLSTPKARAEQRAVDARVAALLELVGLADRGDVDAASLGTGERRLVEVARALAAPPHILLLDEPAAGMDRDDEARLAAVVTDVCRRGLTVVLVEHNMRLVRHVADAVTVLQAGAVIAAGRPDAVLADAAVRHAYLGDAGS